MQGIKALARVGGHIVITGHINECDKGQHLFSCAGTYPVWRDGYQDFYAHLRCEKCGVRHAVKSIGSGKYQVVNQIGG